jgi:hypothetical protein
MAKQVETNMVDQAVRKLAEGEAEARRRAERVQLAGRLKRAQDNAAAQERLVLRHERDGEGQRETAAFLADAVAALARVPARGWSINVEALDAGGIGSRSVPVTAAIDVIRAAHTEAAAGLERAAANLIEERAVLARVRAELERIAVELTALAA